ncbi:alkaline-phosphatase-like protein [Fusarium oxysporum]|nr:alkaline-phosphatase-like protein [Fusarium oxysporum]
MPSLVSYLFAVFFVSLLFTKLLHLFIHIHSIAVIDFVVYLPTFFLQDFFLVLFARLLLRRERTILSLIGYVLGCFLTLITFVAAASELGFHYRTGGEVEWSDAGDFANDEGTQWSLATSYLGIGKRIASGLSLNSIKMLNLLTLAVSRYLRGKIRPQPQHQQDPENAEPFLQRVNSESTVTNSGHPSPNLSRDGDEKELEERTQKRRCCAFIPSWVINAVVLLFIGITWVARPDQPYNHIASSLPLRLSDSLIEKSRWQDPKGNFKGWAPSRENNDLVKKYRENPPAWLPSPIPSGFLKWNPDRYKDEHDKKDGPSNLCPNTWQDRGFYNPVNDPMRITNLDQEILAPIQEALSNNSVKIRHIALILMESMREELFPLQQGSDIHRFIMESNDENARDEVNGRVSRMTQNFEKITGKPGNYQSANGSAYDLPRSPVWNDQTKPGFGGVNVVGGLTSSSVSTKSLAAAHCGAWAHGRQHPCIPQILELFNKVKGNTTKRDDKPEDKPQKKRDWWGFGGTAQAKFHEYQWKPAFFQAVTDHYDRQGQVTKPRLDEEAKDNPEMEEINYFGYPETDLREHIRKFISDGIAEDKRLFMSHFTSTTHHPWGVPKWFEKEKYMGKEGGNHQDLDKYLNTIRFTDAWLGELMQMFEDTGIADETLVVFVPTKTVISATFRVPISFRHPSIPRVQYEANVTSISILPTILDLLVNSGSLNKKDSEIALDLSHDYEGQSLIRPYQKTQDGRRAWNFGLINPGGGMLTVTSADAPWRLAVPLKKDLEYTFTDLGKDPLELDALDKWSIKSMIKAVKRQYGNDAATWVKEADEVAHWWALERRRLWGYNPDEDK